MNNPPLLEVDKLTVAFGGLVAVNEITFSTGSNEVLSIIGPNGAGKTTLFNAVSGFTEPTRGSILFQGRDITGRRPDEIARLGLVRTFQKRSFFPGLSVLESILTGLKESNRLKLWPVLGGNDGLVEEAERILDMTGLSRRRNEIAEGLSYGEQRLLGVALALTSKPKLLLLDEPCAGMNPVEVDAMVRLIEELKNRALAVVVVEHQMRFVMGISDRVIVLDHGEKLVEGPPQDVRSNPSVVEAYLGKGILEHDAPA